MAPPADDKKSPADGKKSPAAKAPSKLETINLKVFIHCQGCKKKVKKILCQIDGVETVDIDASLGKVTVTGSVDSKVLLKKLEKKGKVAEVLSASGGKGKEQQKDELKGAIKEPKKVRFAEAEGDKKGKGGGGGEGRGGGGSESVSNEGGKKGNISGDYKGTSGSNGTIHTGESEKKKKGGDVGFVEVGPSKNTAHKNVTPMMIETGYSIESADYATHIFSDENTDSCCIM